MRKLDNLLAGGVGQGSPVDVNPTKLVHTAVAWVMFRIELKRLGRMCLVYPHKSLQLFLRI